MNIFNATDGISKNPDIIETVIDGVFFILDPGKYAYYTLNDVGVNIWSFIKTQTVTFKAVCGYLQEKYGLDEGQCKTHAYDFIQSMMVKNIVTVDSPCNARALVIDHE